jgi:hypothetical protein
VGALIDITTPIVKLLRVADGDAPSTSKVHWYAWKISDSIGDSTLPASLKAAVLAIWQRRWGQLDSPLHGAGYCLDPEFISDLGVVGNDKADSCFQHLLTMINKLVPENKEKTVRKTVRGHYANFKARSGAFGTPEAWEDARDMPAHQWWEMYGMHAPELQTLAVKVLSQVSSSSACERNWSAYDFIHNRKRNRLTPARARDLVWVFTNGRLADRLDTVDNEEQFIGWDDMVESGDEAT